MKIYLTSSLLNYLVNGIRLNREKVRDELSTLLKKNHSLYTSTLSIQNLFNKRSILLQAKGILSNIQIAVEDILEFNKEDLLLSSSLIQQFNYNSLNAGELALSLNKGIEQLLDTEDTFSNQKLILFRRIILESERDRFR